MPATATRRLRPILGECDSKEWGAKIDDYAWVVVRLTYLKHITGDDEYIAEVCLVSTSEEEEIEKALESQCWKRENCTEEAIVGALFEYGYRDCIWSAGGEKPLPLLMRAYKQADHYL